MVTGILAAVVALIGLISTALGSGVIGLKKENEELKASLAAKDTALREAQAKAELDLGDAVARREKLISELKAELELQEKNNEAIKDPAVVRNRLLGLLNPVP